MKGTSNLNNTANNTANSTNISKVAGVSVKDDSVVIKLPVMYEEFIYPSVFLTLTLVFSYIYKNIIEPAVNKMQASFAYSLDAERQLLELCNRILAKTKADRVLLYLPHDGEKFLTGAHRWKISAKQEAVSPGIERVIRKVQNIDIGQLVKVASYLKEQEGKFTYYVYCKETEHREKLNSKYIEPDFFIEEFYNTHGVHSSVLVALRTYAEGFFLVDLNYIRTECKEADHKQDLKEIESELKQISYIVNNARKNALQLLFTHVYKIFNK